MTPSGKTHNERPKDWQRQYPWTPKKPHTTISQNFAAIRSGILPVIRVDKGEAHYTLLDVFTKDGIKQYEAESRRGIQATTPTKKGK